MSAGLALRIGRSALLAALEPLLTVVGAEPMHQQVQLTARGDTLTLAATSVDRAKITRLGGATVTRAGTAPLPGKKVAECLRTSPEGEAELLVTDGTALLTVGACRWTFALYTGPLANLPELTAVERTTFDGPALASALQKVRYAASKEAYRPHLMQVNVGRKRLTASDGARVAQVAHVSPVEFQLPVAALDDILRVLRTGPVSVGLTPTHLLFLAGPTLLVVAQLAALFPDVEGQLLAPNMRNTETLTISRSELTAAIARARINADPEASALVLALSQDAVRIEARDKFGNATLELLPATWGSGDRRLVLHHKLLSDLLASSEDPTCTLRIGPESATRPSPLIMEGADGVVGLVQSTRLDWLR